MVNWDTELYLQFERERTRAARDLLAHIPTLAPGAIFDLGCGPGNSTQLLVASYPQAKTFGVDVSPQMLSVAQRRVPEATFLQDDIATWRPEKPVDLIFANASLHFLSDHQARLLELVGDLAPGGVLAVQMPNNIHEISHALMRMVAADGPWSERLLPIAKTQALVGAVDEYYELLCGTCDELDIWQTTYVHPLESVDDIVKWFEGSGLRPFLDALDAPGKEAFLKRYRQELDQAYPRQSDQKVLLRYPRLFLIARR